MDGFSLRTKNKLQNIKSLPWKVTSQLDKAHSEADTRYDHILKCQNHRGLDLRLNTHTDMLTIRGSIQTFTKGTNYEGFTYLEFKEGVGELADMLNCKSADLAVINNEISATIKHSPIFKQLEAFGNRPFNPMTSGRTKVYGAVSHFEEYGFKVYDKTKSEYLHHRQRIPENLLQVELLVHDKGYYNNKYFNLPNPSMQDLLKPEVFKASYTHMLTKMDDIRLASSVDWKHIAQTHGLKPHDMRKLAAYMNPSLADYFKEFHPATLKEDKKVFDRVKRDLSETATVALAAFKQDVKAEVESKFNW